MQRLQTETNHNTQGFTVDNAQHVQWLAQWQETRKAICVATDDSTEEARLHDIAEQLSLSLCNTVASTTADLIAQMHWFEEDLGMYVKGNANPAFDLIFQNLRKGAANIQAS